MNENFVRLITIPWLAFVTYQAIMLGRVVSSMAWKMLTAGFLLFFLLLLAIVFLNLHETAQLIVRLIGYTLVGAGIHQLRHDMYKLKSYDRRLAERRKQREEKK